MSGSIPTSQRRVRSQGPGGIVSMPNAAGDTSALGRAIAGLGEVIGGAGTQYGAKLQRDEQQKAVFGADEEARTIPIRDESGNYAVQQRDPLTPQGRVFNAGIAKRILDDMSNRSAIEAVRLRGAAENNPELFQQSWQGYSEGVLAAAPAWMKNEAQAQLGRLGAEHLQGVTQQTINTERRLQAAGWGDRQKRLEQDVLGLAASGMEGTPAFQEAMGRYSAHIRDGVTTRQLAPESADILLQTTRENTTGAATVRKYTDLVAAGGGREVVLAEFDKEMDKQGLPTVQRERLRNLVEGKLSEAQAIRNEGRTELHGTVDDWQTRITGGAVVAPDEAVKLASEAERLGLPRLAAQVRDVAAVQQDARILGQLPTAELAAKAQGYNARLLRDGATARDVKLAEVSNRMVTQRRAAMDADPLAAGATIYRDTVGPLAPLSVRDLASLPAGLRQREQQAALISRREGRPVSALTKAEAEGLKEILADGSADQQQQLLTALTGGLTPTTMAATLDTLTKGTDTNPRTQAFAVAAARSGSNPRQTTEILRGLEVIRQNKPAATEGADWSRALAEELGPVLGTRPDTLAQLGEAARAIYAQRTATGDKPGDLAQRLDTDKFRGILRELMPTVTVGGGWLSGGTRIPTPRPGMTQTEFDTEWAKMPANALAGARAADGRAITPDMVRRDGRLVAVSEGMYEIRIGGMEVLGENGRNFRLDMRQPWQPDPPPEARGGGGGGAGAGPEAITERHRLAFSTMTSWGLTPEQGAGLLANFHHESGVRHDGPTGDPSLPGGSNGLAQWNRERVTKFREVIGRDLRGSSMEEQLRFVRWELFSPEGTHRAAGASLRNAKTAEEAAEIITREYEIPADTDGEARKRARTAARFLPALRGNG